MTSESANAASAAPIAIMNIAIICPERTRDADSTPKKPPGANREKATKESATELNINSRLIITITALFLVKVPKRPIRKTRAERIKILLSVTLNPYPE